MHRPLLLVQGTIRSQANEDVAGALRLEYKNCPLSCLISIAANVANFRHAQMLAHDMQAFHASSLQIGRTLAPGPKLAVRHLRCQATQQETTQHTRITAKPITAAEFAPFGDTSTVHR